MNKTRVVQARVIYGGPSVGKTYSDRLLSSRGVHVVDTDDVTRVVCPGYFRERLWMPRKGEEKRTSALQDLIWTEVGKVCRTILDSRPAAVVFTNLFSPQFTHPLGPHLPNGKIPFGVCRESPEELASIISGRQTVKEGQKAFPIKLAQKWVQAPLRNVSAFVHLVVLPPNDPPLFLEDVVTWEWKFMLPTPVAIPTVIGLAPA